MSTEPEGVTAEAVYALRKFRHDNTPLRTSAPAMGDTATEQDVRDLLLFAAAYTRGDRTLPRTLEAIRVVWLVPEEVGARLFGGAE